MRSMRRVGNPCKAVGYDVQPMAREARTSEKHGIRTPNAHHFSRVVAL